MAPLHRVLSTACEDLSQLALVDTPDRASPQPAWDRPIELVHESGHPCGELVLGEGGGDETDSTGDVEADTAGGDDAARVDVGGGDAADGEAIPPVHVGHRVRSRHDAGKRRHVRDLLECPVVVARVQ